MTETTSLISVNHPFKLGKGSIGKVLPGREVKLAPDGEILIRGGGVATGYWGGREASSGAADGTIKAVADADGWYRTGDVGALDAAGNLYFKGRKKEVIVSSAGLNVYPEDLEAALRQQPEVKDCTVVGIERGGNAEPCAVVILREEANVEEVVGRANQGLAEFQRMRMWVKWPEEDFPRTSTQKPRRNLIREFAEKQLTGEVRGRAMQSPVVELIERITRRPFKGKQITPRAESGAAEADLHADLGLNSLERVELIGALEDRYQVDLGETPVSAVRTVADVEKMLRGETGQNVEYHYPAWVLRPPAKWARWVAQNIWIRPAMFLLGRPLIVGRENLQRVNGPLLVVCNHISDVDFAFVQAALPARLRNRLAIATRGEALEALRVPGPSRGRFAAIYDRMKWTLGVALLNLFPLPRETGFRKSFAYAGMAVDKGYSVLVFPEGRHSLDGKMNSFRAGIGLLARNLELPVLPMRIVGLFEAKQAGRKFARMGEIEVRVGRPLKFPPNLDCEEIARKLETAVQEL